MRGVDDRPPPTRSEKPLRPSCCVPMNTMQLISGALHCAAQVEMVILCLRGKSK